MIKYFHETTRTRKFIVAGDSAVDVKVGGDDDPVEQSIVIRPRTGTLHTPMLHRGEIVDMTTLRSMARDIVKGKRTERAKVEAIHRFCRSDRLWHWAPPPDQCNPVKLVMSYGYGYCVVHSFLFQELCAAAGLKSARVEVVGEGDDRRRLIPHVSDHSCNEAYYEGGWHWYDSDCDSFFEDEGGRVVSARALARRPELAEQTADEYGLTPLGQPVASLKGLFSSMVSIRRSKFEDHPCSADYLLTAGSSLQLDLKPIDALFDSSRLLPPWEMGAHPIFNTGRIRIRVTPREIEDGLLRVKLPYVALSAELPETLLRRFRRIGVSTDGKSWKPVRRGTIRFQDDPMEYYLRLDGRRGTSRGAFIIDNHVQFNSLVAPFLRRGDNRIAFRTKGGEPFTAELVFRWKERSVRKTFRKKQRSVKWSGEEPLCPDRATESGAVSAAVSPSGTVWTAFQVKRGDQYAIRFGPLDAPSECFGEVAAPGAEYAGFPDIVVDSAEAAHVVFQTGEMVTHSDVFYTSTNRPGALVKVNDLDAWRFSWLPRLTLCGGGAVVTWQGPNLSSRSRKPYEWKFAAWVKDLSPKGRSLRYEGRYDLACFPAIAADQRGRLHLLFLYQGADYREIAGDLSKTLSSASIFPYPSDYGFGSDIAIDPQNNVLAVWSSRNYGTRRNVHLRKRTKGRWESCIRLSEGDFTDSQHPSIAAGDDGQVHVVWTDNRTGRWVIFHKRFDGKEWWADSPVSDPRKDARCPKVVVGNDGKAVVFWYYAGRGRSRAVYRREL